MEKYYTPEETGEILRLSKFTIRHYIRNGRLEATKMGRCWRVAESTIKDVLENGWPCNNLKITKED